MHGLLSNTEHSYVTVRLGDVENTSRIAQGEMEGERITSGVMLNGTSVSTERLKTKQK